MQFRDWGGMFMQHCHNTTHEDNAMLLRWEIDFVRWLLALASLTLSASLAEVPRAGHVCNEYVTEWRYVFKMN